ncbi:hypothetical protein D7Z26_00630 [Cohnella endophytica]|uniref:Mannosyl-glycoprotein endo-beta-N-acetylglucosamidase-like domain-containing protein n=1 Tax=Cohnella endophytica TaxID=2419778 RepID=A0A494Y8W8_9BACL|nr:glucosaminidase domain-containing protein [Cohnella endophytica]RKP58048.1 hypothetical protein D7Z26_00630 [Cohnella endophytica]
MRRKSIRQLFIYALGLALILTLGVRAYSANPISNNSDASSSSEVLQLQQPPLTISSPETSFSPESRLAEPPDDPVIAPPEIAKNMMSEVRISASVPVPTMSTYEVTAYYLNVRANAYSTSKVIKVVKKGTKLEIVKRTDNGWLRINGGGYVHAEYTRLIVGAEVAISGRSQNVKQIAKSESLAATEAGDTEKPNPQAMPPAQSVKSVPVGALKVPTPVKPLSLQHAADDNEDPVKPTSTVRTDSGLSEEDVARIFDGTALAGNGLEETVLEVEEQYGINALFTIAVMKLESGNGSSKLARSKNNLFGLNAITGDAHNRAFSFETKGDSVRKFGQLLSKNYVGKGYTTIEKIATKYCPANSNWSGLVKNIMKKDFEKLIA